MVEEGNRVHFLEAGAQGVIEVGSAQVVALSGEESETWCVTWYREGKGVTFRGLTRKHMGRGGVQSNLL